MTAERIAIIGGGAAGFFAAIVCAESNPARRVDLFERSAHFLRKVRISGGGRCNVTHALFDARGFTAHYPRGERALISPFHRFSAAETVAWFEERGVRLKREPDGRMFPVTDSSETVVECLLDGAKKAGVQLFTRRGVERIAARPEGGFELILNDGETMARDRVLLATGGARDGAGAKLAQMLGHTIEPAVPSLFSFNVQAAWLGALPGVSVADAELYVPGTKLRERGPLLITHQGVSGPAVLRLSAWGARVLHAMDYRFRLRVNWLPAMTEADLQNQFQERRRTQPNRQVSKAPISALPARLWESLTTEAGIEPATIWTSLSRAGMTALRQRLRETELEVDGKSLNKDEFVTCGGVRLREVNFKTMESRLRPGLYFAGELLDIDGITGGFNFQSAWTTGWLAGRAMAGKQE